MRRFSLPVFLLFLGIALLVFPQLFSPSPAYASANQVQQNQVGKAAVTQARQKQSGRTLRPQSAQQAQNACDEAGLKPGTPAYVECVRELQYECQNTTVSTPDCYPYEPLSVRCQDPQPQDLEACLTGNTSYDDPNYILPGKTLENPLGTTVENVTPDNPNGRIVHNVPFFVITPSYVTVDNQTIQNIWSTVLGIVDIAAVVLLMLNGLAIIFSGTAFRHADAVQLLPGILLALVAANASMGFMHFFLGLNNVLSGDLWNWADSTLTRTLAGYRRTGPSYDYPQLTYIISLKNGDNEHNAVAFYIAKNLPQTGEPEIQAPVYLKDTELPPLYTEVPKQPLDKNHQVGPGYICKAPGENDYKLATAERIQAEGQVQQAFKAAHLKADPQQYYSKHPRDILGWHTTITYHCSLDAALEEKYLPFYPDHINFSIDLISFFTKGVGEAVVPLVIKVLGAIVYAQMLVRLLMINFYIVTSPLGIACWALPGGSGQRLTRMWLSGFLSLVLVQFLQVVALIATQVMIGAYLGMFHKQLGNEIGPDLLEQVLGIATLWFTLLIPGLLGTDPMRMLVEAGQEMGQVAGMAIAANMAATQAVAQGAAGASGSLSRWLRFFDF